MHHALLHIVNANNNLRCGAFKNRNQKATHGIGRYMVDCKLFLREKKGISGYMRHVSPQNQKAWKRFFPSAAAARPTLLCLVADRVCYE